MKALSIIKRLFALICWALLAAACVCTFYLVAVMGESPELDRAAQGPAPSAAPLSSPRPLDGGVTAQNAAAYFPADLLALGNQTPVSASAADVRIGGETCRIVSLEYTTQENARVRCISATPAAYLLSLTDAGYTPDTTVGLRLRGQNAVHLAGPAGGALIAREGPVVYVLMGPEDLNALYALGEETNIKKS